MKPYLLFTTTITAATAIAIFFSLLLLLPTATPDLDADRAALLALRSAVGGRSLLWNISEPTPCSWPGVGCESGRVAVLRLPGMGLSGQIPPNTIGNLTWLHTLSLRVNALSGPLPADLAAIAGLRNLYLQQNLFSGEIPDFLFSLYNLVRLNLAANNFSGEISPRFNNLTRLGTLYLEDNQLTGPIPDLDLPSLVQFNVSNNQLTGSVPSRLSRKPASAFAGNLLCGSPLSSCNGTTESKSKNKLSGGAIAGIIVGSVIGFFLIVAMLICLCRRKSNSPTESKQVGELNQKEIAISAISGEKSAEDSDSLSAVKKLDVNVSGKKGLVFFGKSERVFDLEDLLRASAEVLGKGTFGTAYKAVLEVGMVVAVKRLKDVAVPEKEFREKIEAVGARNHENLVPLRAYYYSRDEKLLVYDYMSMGSLSALFYMETKELEDTVKLGNKDCDCPRSCTRIALPPLAGSNSSPTATSSHQMSSSPSPTRPVCPISAWPNLSGPPPLLTVSPGTAHRRKVSTYHGGSSRWFERNGLPRCSTSSSLAEVNSRIEELCRSSLEQQRDPPGNIVNDTNGQQAFSVDSGAPHSSAAE
ncbi:receptor-like kinase 902 [Actinidia rufa]|uniref:Receptor-like kinase 902 n=1 Tax=Actinidia rufa TaxID=165716 RepID=A0A7J0EMY9_9ERIC|nr:receptor-like kinase 902 [Actinidia rufa]